MTFCKGADVRARFRGAGCAGPGWRIDFVGIGAPNWSLGPVVTALQALRGVALAVAAGGDSWTRARDWTSSCNLRIASKKDLGSQGNLDLSY